jgi:3-ketosteroid 9alpha-monooxygenase subunit B
MNLDHTKFCHKLKIANRIQETSDSVSLVLEIPDELKGKFKYRAGQFVTFFMDIAGKVISRSYSLASSPDYDSDFKVSVKLVPGGLGSTYLLQTVKVGEVLWTTPPAGLFCLPGNFKDGPVMFYAAGSGVTPIMSLIKTVLQTSSTTCALFYQNRDEGSILFCKELADLEAKFANRFSVTHILSTPPAHWSGLKGRCSKDVIHEFLKQGKANSSTQHFLCGPEGFMKTVGDALADKGVDKKHVHTENFGTGQSHAPLENAVSFDDKIPALNGGETWIGQKDTRANPQEIEVVLDGETQTVPYKGGATVLETLLEAGLNPPYSCMDGACMACMGKVEGGLVYQKDPGILSEDNIEANECLTCQARPASRKVKINYSVF